MAAPSFSYSYSYSFLESYGVTVLFSLFSVGGRPRRGAYRQVFGGGLRCAAR